MDIFGKAIICWEQARNILKCESHMQLRIGHIDCQCEMGCNDTKPVLRHKTTSSSSLR